MRRSLQPFDHSKWAIGHRDANAHTALVSATIHMFSRWLGPCRIRTYGRTQSFREIDWNIICNLMCHMNYGFMINAIKYHYLMRRRAHSFICPAWETLRWHLGTECAGDWCVCVRAWHCGSGAAVALVKINNNLLDSPCSILHNIGSAHCGLNYNHPTNGAFHERNDCNCGKLNVYRFDGQCVYF